MLSHPNEHSSRTETSNGRATTDRTPGHPVDKYMLHIKGNGFPEFAAAYSRSEHRTRPVCVPQAT